MPALRVNSFPHCGHGKCSGGGLPAFFACSFVRMWALKARRWPQNTLQISQVKPSLCDIADLVKNYKAQSR